MPSRGDARPDNDRNSDMQPIKLAIISTHPVQYYAPVFRGLAQTKLVQPRVFYTWSQSSAGPVRDAGFGIHYPVGRAVARLDMNMNSLQTWQRGRDAAFLR